MNLLETFLDLSQVTPIQVSRNIKGEFEFALPSYPDKNNKMNRFFGTFEQCINAAIQFLFDKEKPKFEELQATFESKLAAFQILEKWRGKSGD